MFEEEDEDDQRSGSKKERERGPFPKFGDAIQARRKELKLTLEAVAHPLGLKYQSIQNYERGWLPASAPTLFELLRTLRVNPSQFLSDHEVMGEIAVAVARLQNQTDPNQWNDAHRFARLSSLLESGNTQLTAGDIRGSLLMVDRALSMINRLDREKDYEVTLLAHKFAAYNLYINVKTRTDQPDPQVIAYALAMVKMAERLESESDFGEFKAVALFRLADVFGWLGNGEKCLTYAAEAVSLAIGAEVRAEASRALLHGLRVTGDKVELQKFVRTAEASIDVMITQWPYSHTTLCLMQGVGYSKLEYDYKGAISTLTHTRQYYERTWAADGACEHHMDTLTALRLAEALSKSNRTRDGIMVPGLIQHAKSMSHNRYGHIHKASLALEKQTGHL